MSILDFVKDAGRALGIGGTEAPTADQLKAAVGKLGLNASNLDVKVDGDKAVVSGQAASQEDKEKIALALGNTKGIAAVEDNIQVRETQPGQAQQAAASFYTVQSGDTLSAIAKKMYGNANKYEAIFRANQPMLSDPDEIYPGQVLRIPPREH